MDAAKGGVKLIAAARNSGSYRPWPYLWLKIWQGY